MQLIHTDSLGNFKMDSVIFYDRVSMLFSDIRGKKSKFIKVKMDADSLNKKYPVETLRIPFKSQADAATENKMKEEYSNYLKAEGLMLANVTVKTRQKSKTEQMEDRYSSSLFAGSGNSRVLDLRNETITNLDIFDYLRGRIPGLTIDRDNEGQYRISYRDGGMGSGNVSLYLDEMRTDAIFIESIPVNQIAYVKLMPHFAGSFGGGTALAVYMKKGAELSAATEAATDIINYTGYSVIKEFYSPNYAVRLPEHAKADNRLTLLWNPNLYLANINPKIPLIFYNNDRTKRFKVVVEGMTSDGKMMMVEKIIEPGKNNKNDTHIN